MLLPLLYTTEEVTYSTTKVVAYIFPGVLISPDIFTEPVTVKLPLS